MRSTKKILLIFCHLFLIGLFGLIWLLAFSGFRLVDYLKDTFSIGIQEILFTISAPVKGANARFLLKIFHYIKVPAILAFISFLIIIFLYYFLKKKKAPKTLFRIISIFLIAALLIRFIYIYRYLDQATGITEHIQTRNGQTTIYDDYYIDPANVTITAESPKNLIYIYVESLENTYQSIAEGGFQPEYNYIPLLTSLAKENLNFSNSSNYVGGWRAITGTTWTTGAIFAATSGIPFAYPIGRNDMSKFESFAPNLTTLGDFLEENGYAQEFLCGSDAVFGGKQAYFTSHGNYEIYDYYSAIENGVIPPDYLVWWGFEDEVLYQIAKDETVRLASQSQPFNLTILTVDTHHVDGYPCDLCEKTYLDRLANVLVCADKQVTKFVSWVEEQPFAKDTVIIITGDHPRMDTSLVDGISLYDRTVYDCIIGAEYDPDTLHTTREFTAMDMFPTTLSALGFHIDGNRLGLGVNLFSTEPTLLERLGFETFDNEVSQYSKYYKDHFY